MDAYTCIGRIVFAIPLPIDELKAIPSTDFTYNLFFTFHYIDIKLCKSCYTGFCLPDIHEPSLREPCWYMYLTMNSSQLLIKVTWMHLSFGFDVCSCKEHTKSLFYNSMARVMIKAIPGIPGNAKNLELHKLHCTVKQMPALLNVIWVHNDCQIIACFQYEPLISLSDNLQYPMGLVSGVIMGRCLLCHLWNPKLPLTNLSVDDSMLLCICRIWQR